jgi:dTDP-4-dehydrorhamnose 3,5-epimerase-like enzyme
MIARRFAADEVGNHFHPRIPNKDPERFLLIVGRMRVWFKDVFGDVREEVVDADVQGPTQIEIPPYILHRFIVLTETAWFLEQQRTAFRPEDNYTPPEFSHLSKLVKM